MKNLYNIFIKKSSIKQTYIQRNVYFFFFGFFFYFFYKKNKRGRFLILFNNYNLMNENIKMNIKINYKTNKNLI